MKRLTLATSLLLFFSGVVAQGQSVARTNPTLRTSTPSNDAQQAIEQLKRLEQSVIVYKSLGEFEETGKLASVPIEAFTKQLAEVTVELNQIMARLPASKMKDQLANSLASYRDGAFWWAKLDQRRVVSVAALEYESKQIIPLDAAFASTIPYTVAVHWRQASRYLAKAERNLVQ